MKYPKKKDQMDLIGTVCTFKRNLYAQYFKDGSRKWVRSASGYKEQFGKIVGFGYTYNGKYIPESGGFFDSDDTDVNYAHFKPSKRVVHIKVRIKGEGKSIKVHPIDCKIVKEKK